MGTSVHSLVQNSDDLVTVFVGCTKEDHMAALWEFPITLSYGVCTRSDLRRSREAFECIKQFGKVGVSLSFAPLLERMFCDFPQIGVCCPGDLEGSHWC